MGKKEYSPVQWIGHHCNYLLVHWNIDPAHDSASRRVTNVSCQIENPPCGICDAANGVLNDIYRIRCANGQSGGIDCQQIDLRQHGCLRRISECEQ